MIIMLFALVLVLGTAIVAIVYVMPITNKFFALIWEDPTFRQKPAALKRMQELMVDSDMPPETAVMIAARENHIQEQQLLEILDGMSAVELKACLTGTKAGLLSVFSRAISRKIKAGHGKNRQSKF